MRPLGSTSRAILAGLVVFSILFVVCSYAGTRETGEVSETEFYGIVESNTPMVLERKIRDDGVLIKGTYGKSNNIWQIKTLLDPDGANYHLIDQDPDISITTKGGGGFSFLSLLFAFLPFILMIGIVVFMMRRAQGGPSDITKFGQNASLRVIKETPNISFDDVAGAEEAKEDCEEIIHFLQYPHEYHKVGAKFPKGMLFYGPPGCGKTLLARAVAGEAQARFFTMPGSGFVEMFVGVGAARVRDLFEQAKNSAKGAEGIRRRPSIIFIDEIDAVGRQRGAGLGGGHDEREQTLNEILNQMDGFDQNTNVIVIAATNRPDILDPALTRAGRFDLKTEVKKPDRAGRLAILKVHAKGKPLADDVDLGEVAKRTWNMSGADLASTINFAAITAAREFDANDADELEGAHGHGAEPNYDKRFRKEITMAHMYIGIERAKLGRPTRSRVIPQQEKERVAFHEMGHGIVGWVEPHANPPTQITCVPHGSTGGATEFIPEEELSIFTKEQLQGMLAAAMGGQAAERILCGSISTGASDDIERATNIARAMVTQYGMSDKIGPMNVSTGHEHPFLGRDIETGRQLSPTMQSLVDEEMEKLLLNAFETAIAIVQENEEIVKKAAKYIMADEKETIHEEQIAELFKDAKMPE